MRVRRSGSATLLSPSQLLLPTCPPRPRWSRPPLIMLVLHPSSQCDVCLEGYYGSKEPVSILVGTRSAAGLCSLCLQSLPKPACPLCRSRFEPDDVRRVHVDKTQLPPSTPSLSFASIDAARRLQAQATRLVLHGGSTDEYLELIGELGSWLETQYPQEHGDLRATHVLLWKYGEIQKKLEKQKSRVATVEQACSDKIAVVEQNCSDRIAAVEQTCHDLQRQIDEEREKLNAQLQEERELAAAKYEELEQKSFEERELLLAAEKELEEEKERLAKECEEWRAKCDHVSTERRRLADELSKVKRHSSPRADESGYFHPYDRKTEIVPAQRDYALDRDVVKDKDNFFLFSPVPLSQPVPDLPSNMSHFNPLADDPDDSSDEALEKGNSMLTSSTSRSIPIKHRSDLHRDRSRSNVSLLSRPDPDAMSISVPRNNVDVHMAGSSVSPNGPAFQYGSRPKEFVPSSLERLPENALGLRADLSRPALTDVDPELRVRQLAQLHDVLKDPTSSTSAKSPRKPSVSDGYERERARARVAVSSAMSSTRTPSPVSSTSQSYSSSHMEKEYSSTHHKPNATVISSASSAAAERERARASSVNSQNAPSAPPPPSSVPPHHPAVSVPSTTSLSHITAMRDPPLHALYAPQMQSQSAPRPAQTRRQSNDSHSLSGSLSKGRTSALGVVPPQRYPSNLTRAMQGIPS
ncbi:hypothetical protein C8T65DRAFT_116229 [Cerioporus squamosus]|nr:hypothetical protein C8T65DRAFT_116229 [Cerioporus squamosus]